MARKLYVHIGPTKTGTSAIQSALSRHDGSAVIYPKAGRFEPHGSHHGLVRAYFKDGGTEASNGSGENPFREFAANVAGSQRNVLISSEWIIPKKRRAVDFIRHLVSLAGGASWEVEVLLVCRDHFERAASTYSQCIKGVTEEQRDPDEFLLDRVNKYLYARLVRPFLQAGLKVTALNYHPSDTWLERFLTYVGFAQSEFPEREAKNISLSTKALIAQLCACKNLRQAKERETFWNALKQMPGVSAPSHFIFGPDAAATAEQSFAGDRKFLQEQFGLELPEPDLDRRKSEFFLTAADLADIGEVARAVGESGNAIMDYAARYVRE